VRQEATSGSSRKCIALILTQDFGLFLHQERVTNVSVEPFPIAPQKVLPSFLEMGHCIICCWGVVVLEHNNIPKIPFSAIGAELMISSHITLFIVKHITSLAIICAFGFWTPQQNLWENHISFLIFTKKKLIDYVSNLGWRHWGENSFWMGIRDRDSKVSQMNIIFCIQFIHTVLNLRRLS